MEAIERDMVEGRWVPSYYGNRFKAARLLKDRCRTQETAPTIYQTLAECQEACRRLNDE